MASQIIGRADCPECGFKAAHVKQSDKCVYRYCPECSSQHHARTTRQREDLLKKTRILEPSPTPTESKAAPPPPPAAAAPVAAPDTPEPTPEPAPPKRRGLFS